MKIPEEWWITSAASLAGATVGTLLQTTAWRAGIVIWISGGSTAIFIGPALANWMGITTPAGLIACGFSFGAISHILMAAFIKVVIFNSETLVGKLISKALRLPINTLEK